MKCTEFKIINFDKYNPRTDRKAHSWLRLENTIMMEPKLFGLSAAQKWGLVCLFGAYSKARSDASSNKVSDSTYALYGASSDNESVYAVVYDDHFAHMVGITTDEFHSLIQHLIRVKILRLSPGNQVVTSGNRPVAGGSTTITITNTNTDLTKQETPTTQGEAPRNPNPPRRDVFGDHMRCPIGERVARDRLMAGYPVKRGWNYAWPLIRTMLVDGGDNAENVLADLERAVKNYADEQRTFARPADKIKTFGNFIKEGLWADYVQPEENQDFSGEVVLDQWQKLALFMLESLRGLSPGHSGDRLVLEQRLGPVGFTIACRLTGGLGILWKLEKEERGAKRLAELLKQTAERLKITQVPLGAPAQIAGKSPETAPESFLNPGEGDSGGGGV